MHPEMLGQVQDVSRLQKSLYRTNLGYRRRATGPQEVLLTGVLWEKVLFILHTCQTEMKLFLKEAKLMEQYRHY